MFQTEFFNNIPLQHFVEIFVEIFDIAAVKAYIRVYVLGESI